MIANSADPDEMPHFAAFHLGLYYFPNDMFSRIQTRMKRVNCVNIIAHLVTGNQLLYLFKVGNSRCAKGRFNFLILPLF